MTIIIKKTYYHICSSKKGLFISQADLTRGVKPLIWFNQGLWGIISAEKIRNILDNIQDRENLPTLDKKKEIGKFYWDDVEIIPAKIAKLLFENSDNESTATA